MISLIEYRPDHIAEILLARTDPIMESSLIRLLSEQHGYPRLSGENLFAVHFSLYHTLYTMRKDCRFNEFYIHITPMSISMTPFPQRGWCRHYLEDRGTFCHEPAVSHGYCLAHTLDPSVPVADFLTSFYLEVSNIEYGEREDIYERMNRILHYGIHKREVDRALEFFGFTELNRDRIQKEYRTMAAKNHPDRGGDPAKMSELNHHYDILKSIF